MQRNRRFSRPLFAVLAAVLILGAAFYYHHARHLALQARAKTPAIPAISIIRGTAPSDEPAPLLAATGSAPTAVATSDATPALLITSTPPIASVGAAAPAPTTPAVAASAPPTTQPVALLATNVTPARPNDAVPHNISAPAIAAAPTTAPSASTADLLADARAKQSAGDLVAAREQLNAALLSGNLSPADADATRKAISDINQTLIFSPHRTAGDPWATGYPVQSGERLSTIANKNSLTWQFLARINHTDPKHLRAGSTIKVIKGPFFAVVTKSKFRMDIYLGSPGGPDSMYVTSFIVGLGKNDSTPTGTWQVQSGNKILHPRYYSPENQGVIDADDPKNPLGGYWIGLEGIDGQAVDKHSYGIHGTIDPDSIGKQASMGCIRMAHDDIDLTFAMLVEVKSKIVVNP